MVVYAALYKGLYSQPPIDLKHATGNEIVFDDEARGMGYFFRCGPGA